MTRPHFSVFEYSTPRLSFVEDLDVYSEAGIEGIGIDAALKLHGDPDELLRFRASGLKATSCFPRTSSILPLPLLAGASDLEVRIQQVCDGIRELAPFEPVSCVCLTGPRGNYEAEQAWEIVADGISRVARFANELGITISLEAVHKSIESDWSILTTIPETIAMIDEVGEPNVKMLVDVWHVWDTPDVLDHVRRHASKCVGVHVNDWREPTRGFCDRVLPGDGVADVTGIVRSLVEGGFDGWFELELLSDDGLFGTDYPDSLWKRNPLDLVRDARQQFTEIWVRATTPMSNDAQTITVSKARDA